MTASAADDILRLYQEHADAWRALRVDKRMEKPWIEAFQAAMPAGGCEVLDLGCGTGIPVARALIAGGCRITGVDGAPAMILHAQRNFPDHAWITADMRDLPPLGRFHGVIAWHSFFHLTPEDQRGMFPVFARLCHPGAALMFTSGPRHGAVIGTFQGQPLYHASLDPAEYRDLLQANGFAVVRHVAKDPSCGDATVWLARRV